MGNVKLKIIPVCFIDFLIKILLLILYYYIIFIVEKIIETIIILKNPKKIKKDLKNKWILKI